MLQRTFQVLSDNLQDDAGVTIRQGTVTDIALRKLNVGRKSRIFIDVPTNRGRGLVQDDLHLL
ncbi:MAG: hypothetical protein CXZ00_14560 [Acidobacteria bacterium]|nr:MAG: hypothetical protein CXZ00_14560 [Acidobacteriota bacterium]